MSDDTPKPAPSWPLGGGVYERTPDGGRRRIAPAPKPPQGKPRGRKAKAATEAGNG